ncbi:MAG: hypothetical protein KJ626_10780 [Verrucomicrobia bacterium]|nr:hypothetical protein [Verrucomicrobiota bacterium]
MRLVVERQPSVQFREDLGYLLLMTEDYTESCEHLRFAHETNTNKLRTAFYLACAEGLSGKTVDCKDRLAVLIASNPDEIRDWFATGSPFIDKLAQISEITPIIEDLLPR